jgi:cytochrome c
VTQTLDALKEVQCDISTAVSEMIEEEEVASGAKEKPLDIGRLLAAASAENGQKIAKKCLACHTFEKGGINKVGPNLHNVVGANKGAHTGFAYSPAMSEAGGTWDHEALFAFLKSPKKYIKGTKMAFAGLRKPEDLADMVAYLRQQTENPPAIPVALPDVVENITESIGDAVEALGDAGETSDEIREEAQQ